MPTAAYIAKEEALTRKPGELYHIWRDGGGHLYYTSEDVSVVFDSNTYTPATIKRGMIKKDSEFEVSTLSVQAMNLTDVTSDFFAINPVEVLWISIAKIHREQSPLEANILFLGQIKEVSFSGIAAEITCVGFELFLKMPIPQWRFQTTCNHKVFDTNCALTKASYKTTTTITLDATGTQLTSSTFGTKANGYFTGGEITFEDEHRGIIAHVGTLVTLGYPMKNLVTGNTIDAYPGCDGRPETCRDKFNNVIHSLWFKYIPIDNPTQRTSL